MTLLTDSWDMNYFIYFKGELRNKKRFKPIDLLHSFLDKTKKQASYIKSFEYFWLMSIQEPITGLKTSSEDLKRN